MCEQVLSQHSYFSNFKRDQVFRFISGQEGALLGEVPGEGC